MWRAKLFEDYIHDMKLTQQFAMLNRKAMVDVIMTGMGFTAVETFTTIHNYIDTDAMILRKGLCLRQGRREAADPLSTCVTVA